MTHDDIDFKGFVRGVLGLAGILAIPFLLGAYNLWQMSQYVPATVIASAVP
jgi:hypothetical protein